MMPKVLRSAQSPQHALRECHATREFIWLRPSLFADYAHSLAFLRRFRERYPQVPTKSGLMVGLGETDEEILAVMRDLREHGVEMLTIGQYLAPSAHHLPVLRYVPPETFARYEAAAGDMGFSGATCAPMVRSSYWADQQASRAGVGTTDENRGG